MRVKKLADPVEVEPPRSGEDAAECVACNTPDDAYIWVSERWRVRGMDRPTGLPMVLILECRSHLDIGDLPNLLAAELGVMTVRLERAIRTLDGVARVHVNRWGDGSAHLHMWFLARPYGRLQLRGTFLSLWDDILPVIPEEQWLENLALVAAWLADFGGRAIAEPPHINWLSPSTFSNEPTAEADTSATADAWRDGGPADPESNLPRAGSPSSALDPSDTGSDTDIGGPSRGGVNDVAAETRDLAAYTALVAAAVSQDRVDGMLSSPGEGQPNSEPNTSELETDDPGDNNDGYEPGGVDLAAKAPGSDLIGAESTGVEAAQRDPMNVGTVEEASVNAGSGDQLGSGGIGFGGERVTAGAGSASAGSSTTGSADADLGATGEPAGTDSNPVGSHTDGPIESRLGSHGGGSAGATATSGVKISAIPPQYRPSDDAVRNELDGSDNREVGAGGSRPQADKSAATVVPENR
jgi:hypothetical protein